MKNIILSINPEHVNNIINGTKRFEYRTKATKTKIDRIYIYATAPIKSVVAEVEVKEILMVEPEDLWNITKEYSGITKSFFDSYLKDRNIAYAYKLGKVKVYSKPKSLEDFGLKYAPQSFVYV